MSGWFYFKEGFIEDKELGPLTDATFLQMAFDGTLKLKTKVRHEKHTRNQWAYLEQIPAAKKKAENGEADRAEKMTADKAAKDERKRQQAAAREEARLKKDEEKAAKQQTAVIPVPPARQVVDTVDSVHGQLVPAQPSTIAVPTEQRVACPFCGESIASTAVKCRHCNEFLDPRFRQQQPHQPIVIQQAAAPAPAQNITMVVNQQTNVGFGGRRWSRLVAMLLSLVLPGLGQLYKRQAINGLVWFIIVLSGYFAFIVPGIVLHICCILGAGMGNTSR
ncbi:MAG: hypothetical protein AB7O38_03600 [Pirellulaceae bacterium]